MGEYIIGGWSQELTDIPPSSFSYAMYGMVTNFTGLTTGTSVSPGWNPGKITPPQHPPCKVLWAYGGAGGLPLETPTNQADIQAIVDATTSRNWDGVDIDNESDMNISNLVQTTIELKNAAKDSSYTFLAGWTYNNTPQPAAEIKQMFESGAAQRFILMCYGDAMWSMSDIEANVGPAIQTTLDQSVPAKQIILALTPDGLTQENLDYFLGQVTKFQIGGLFIWEFGRLASDDLEKICGVLGVG